MNLYFFKKYFLRVVIALAAGLVISLMSGWNLSSEIFLYFALITFIVEIIVRIRVHSNGKQYNKDSMLKSFPVILQYIKRVRSFYQDSLMDFIWTATICVVAIVLAGSDKFGIYESVEFIDQSGAYKGLSIILAEGFLKNIRFFVYESAIIGLLSYCLKKISYCISMIENYKELEVFLFIDAQRQQINDNECEKNTVSKDFQEKFCEMFLSGKKSVNGEGFSRIKTSSDFFKELFESKKIK